MWNRDTGTPGTVTCFTGSSCCWVFEIEALTQEWAVWIKTTWYLRSSDEVFFGVRIWLRTYTTGADYWALVNQVSSAFSRRSKKFAHKTRKKQYL